MRQTSDKLKLRETSTFWMQLLVGESFLVFGLSFSFLSGSFPLYLCAVISFFLLIFTQINSVIFDKNLGYLIFNQQQPLIFKTKIVKHLIQDISGVEIQEIVGTESNTYRICLAQKSGKRSVPLTSYFSSGLEDKQKQAQVIATFLNIKNYGLEGVPRQKYIKLEWETIEAEIFHWKTAIRSDSNDPDAYMKLALALLSQDKIKHKEQTISYLKQAEAIFKTQGYGEEAMQAAQLWGVVYWEVVKK